MQDATTILLEAAGHDTACQSCRSIIEGAGLKGYLASIFVENVVYFCEER